MIERITRFCAKRYKLVIILWVIAASGLLLTTTIKKPVWISEVSLPQSESTQAMHLLTEELSDAQVEGTLWQGNIVFYSSDGISKHKESIKNYLNELEKIDSDKSNITDIRSPLDLDNASQISKDGKTAYAIVSFRTDRPYQNAGSYVLGTADELRKSVDVEYSGLVFDALKAPHNEVYGIIAALIILFIVLGSLVSAGLPAITAICGVMVGSSLVKIISLFFGMPEVSFHIGLMLGVGVGIDYALFILTRYKTAIHEGSSNIDAIIQSMTTAGYAVFSAGITVVISIAGILLINLDYLNGIALGASLSVAIMIATALTFVPAMLGSPLHRYLERIPLPHFHKKTHEENHRWIKWSNFVQRHALIGVIFGISILLLISSPILTMRIGVTDVGNESPKKTTKKAYDLLAKGFGPGYNGPLILVVDRKENKDHRAFISLMREISAAEGVERIYPNPETINAALALSEGIENAVKLRNPDEELPEDRPSISNRRIIPLVIYPSTAPQDQRTTDLVHEIRQTIAPKHYKETKIKVYVTGITAGTIDFADTMVNRIPFFMGAVLIISFLFLLFIFESVLVALKAIIMNLFSIGASYGVVIAIFQWGWLRSLLGVGQPGPIEPWAPMMLFAILFGLSMDYEVFLLSKMKEEYAKTSNNSKAVAHGLASTARVITAAALIMVFVFGSFALSDYRPVKLMGLGLAVAVFLDATVVRMLLVPATMELLGDKNWWCPRFVKKAFKKHAHASG